MGGKFKLETIEFTYSNGKRQLKISMWPFIYLYNSQIYIFKKKKKRFGAGACHVTLIKPYNLIIPKFSFILIA